MTKTFRLLVLSALAIAALSACGGDDAPADAGFTPNPDAAAPPPDAGQIFADAEAPDPTCEPACDLSACQLCDLSGAEPVCRSFCADGLVCDDGTCVAPVVPTCEPTCGPCQVCDTSGATLACRDVCSGELTCQDGVCVAEEIATCAPACGACEMCDTTGAAPACVSLCAEGTTCQDGLCTPPPPVVVECNPACEADELCDISTGTPTCLARCGAFERWTGTRCVRSGIHETFEVLSGPFADGPAVTTACLTCHQDDADHFMQTPHWRWLGETPDLVGQVEPATVAIGKKNLINNFCIAVPSNEQRCAQCHAGYGYTGPSFDFDDATRIDCLVCHADPRAGYAKQTGTGGTPVATADLVLAAQTVGAPQRANCGSCHFSAGGGDNVKMGDMGSALRNPTREIDVHMGDGFQCIDCHAGSDHRVPGSGVSVAVSSGRLDCIDCHGPAVHTDAILNSHALDIACETCHIPAFSRTQPTKMVWDWSTAGNKTLGTNGVVTATLPDGTPYTAYDWMKGDFVWEKEVTPHYAWYDGQGTHMTLASTYTAAGTEADPVVIAAPTATKATAAAKIHPFKQMRGRQAAHVGRHVLLAPKLFGPQGFWGRVPAASAYTPDGVRQIMTESLDRGAHAAGQLGASETLAGTDWDWVWTVMYMNTAHEVAPKEDALGANGACTDCHGATGRMNWQALGYACDPVTSPGACGSRH
ncbi:tetrathionate reductase family octaheme c-type cytochrome [Myxococcota bacterium]|nr:tetrathionate reductase family octaheme c-type cytochrome [Myxococcota bacterium]